MHLVKRGTEPKTLADTRNKYTPRWVAHYEETTGTKPSDSKWTSFHEDVKETFRGLCGYCETRAKGEIDHFKPKALYPSLVYIWENWVFSCHDCNHAKGSKFPEVGYVDPCGLVEDLGPEGYFTFDTITWFVVPREGLSDRQRHRAQVMINDLRLNDWHHLVNRNDAVNAVTKRFEDGPVELTSSTRQWVEQRTANDRPHSSAVRAWLSERGYPAGTLSDH